MYVFEITNTLDMKEIDWSNLSFWIHEDRLPMMRINFRED